MATDLVGHSNVVHSIDDVRDETEFEVNVQCGPLVFKNILEERSIRGGVPN